MKKWKVKNKFSKKFFGGEFDFLYGGKQVVKTTNSVILSGFLAHIICFHKWLWSHTLWSLKEILVIWYMLEDLSLISTFCFLLRKKVKHIRHLEESHRVAVSETCPGASVPSSSPWGCCLYNLMVCSSPCLMWTWTEWTRVGNWTVWLDLPCLMLFAHLWEHCTELSIIESSKCMEITTLQNTMPTLPFLCWNF